MSQSTVSGVAGRRIRFAALLLLAPCLHAVAQPSLTQTEFSSIFPPGGSTTALVPPASVTTVNLGRPGGPTVYDFSGLSYEPPFVSHNFFVDSIPLLAPRYPSGAFTFGATRDTIQNNPVFFIARDTLFQAGNVTLGEEYRFRHFTPPAVIMPFPLSFGQSFSRSASYTDSTFDLGWNLIRAIGTDQPSSCVVDGYGTLVIPGHAAPCLRLMIDFPKYDEKAVLYVSTDGFMVNIDLAGVHTDSGVVPFEGMGVLVAGTSTGIAGRIPVATDFALDQNYPNPFNPATVIRAQWPTAREVHLEVDDLLGRRVAVLADGWYPAGRFSFRFDGTGLASGVYFCRLRAGASSATRAMVLAR